MIARTYDWRSSSHLTNNFDSKCLFWISVHFVNIYFNKIVSLLICCCCWCFWWMNAWMESNDRATCDVPCYFIILYFFRFCFSSSWRSELNSFQLFILPSVACRPINIKCFQNDLNYWMFQPENGVSVPVVEITWFYVSAFTWNCSSFDIQKHYNFSD